jgi:hypothetical protein
VETPTDSCNSEKCEEHSVIGETSVSVNCKNDEEKAKRKKREQHVSEIVDSKMKRKVQRTALIGSIMREKQKSKASGKEHVTNTEADENCYHAMKTKNVIYVCMKCAK